MPWLPAARRRRGRCRVPRPGGLRRVVCLRHRPTPVPPRADPPPVRGQPLRVRLIPIRRQAGHWRATGRRILFPARPTTRSVPSGRQRVPAGGAFRGWAAVGARSRRLSDRCLRLSADWSIVEPWAPKGRGHPVPAVRPSRNGGPREHPVRPVRHRGTTGRGQNSCALWGRAAAGGFSGAATGWCLSGGLRPPMYRFPDYPFPPATRPGRWCLYRRPCVRHDLVDG